MHLSTIPIQKTEVTGIYSSKYSLKHTWWGLSQPPQHCNTMFQVKPENQWSYKRYPEIWDMQPKLTLP